MDSPRLLLIEKTNPDQPLWRFARRQPRLVTCVLSELADAERVPIRLEGVPRVVNWLKAAGFVVDAPDWPVRVADLDGQLITI
jgi:hypothetical protein